MRLVMERPPVRNGWESVCIASGCALVLGQQMAAKMKQIRRLSALWAVLLLGQTTGALGQQKDVHLGLALAPNLSHGISRDYAHEPVSPALRFGYKFIFDYKFTDTYAIGTGVNVFHAGATIRHFAVADTSTVNTVEWNVRNQYVEVPLTFKMRTKEIGYTTYYGQFGVGLGLNVRAEVDESASASWGRTAQGEPWDLLVSEDVEPQRMNFDASTRLFRPSLIVGLGAERSLLGKTAICAGLAYNMGLANQFSDQTTVRTHSTGLPVDESGASFGTGTATGAPFEQEMKGKTGFLELSFGVMF